MKYARTKFPCEACEEETHYAALKQGLCPKCYRANYGTPIEVEWTPHKKTFH